MITQATAMRHLEGERNTKYVINLENQHYKEKTINKLMVKN
jgi:hypothetical protein